MSKHNDERTSKLEYGRDGARSGEPSLRKTTETPAPTAPDLQELVARYGGYNKIPPEAWAQWDADTAAYQAWIRRKM